MIEFLKHNKRYWLPPILIVAAALFWFAWQAATTPGSPFEYSPN